MNKEEVLTLLKKDERSVFNAYREANPQWVPNLSGENISKCDLVGNGSNPVNLNNAILCGTAMPSGTKLIYRGVGPSLRDAIIDTETSGPSLSTLQGLGARFASKDQIAKKNEAASTQIFISYAWANSQVVSAIDQWLRLKGLNTKIDKRDFFAGSRIRDEILRLMKASNVVLVFHSLESKDKPWIEFERELVADIQMSAKKEGKLPPRVIYIVIDDTPLPSISEDNRIVIMAKSKRFDLVCEEIYHHILQLPREMEDIDLSKWDDYVF